MQPYSFNIVKHSDKTLIERISQLLKQNQVMLQSINILHTFGASIAQGNNIDTVIGRPELQHIINQNSELLSSINITLGKENFTLNIQREQNSFDKVTINVPSNTLPDNIFTFLGQFREIFQAIDSNSQAHKFLTTAEKKHYEVRESELSKIKQISESITKETEIFRKAKEEELVTAKLKLQEEHEKKQEELKNEFEEKKSKLEELTQQLDKRTSELDDRDSKHARRKIRDDLQKVFLNREKEFKLTKGTRNLRLPITIICTLIFSILAIENFVSSQAIQQYITQAQFAKSNLNLTDPAFFALIIKQILFLIALGSTTIFFIKWTNRWFQQHANEEFYLKRLSLDIDRASWLIESVMEWKNEFKDRDIPDKLIESLSKNLFEYEKKDEIDLHPADQLASAILGTAANLKVKTALGEIVLDKSGLKNLRK